MNIIKKRDKPIGTVIKDFVTKNDKINKGIATVSIEQIFKKRMGKMVASYTKQIFLKGSTLFIYIESAPLRAELSMSKKSLIDALNEEMGGEIISEIIFK